MLRTLLALASLALIPMALAQSAYSSGDEIPEVSAPRDISALLRELVEKHSVPALAAVLIEGDTIKFEGVAGVRARGAEQLATLDDQWHLGSCAKAMTATLAAILVDRQELTWNSTLVDVFPKLKLDDAQPGDGPSWSNATLGMLVTNTGGAPASLDRDGLWRRLWETNEPPAQARRMLIDGVVKNPPEYKPGTKFVYANANFAIAGAMLERTAGVPFEHLMQRELFDALNIRSAGFGAPGVPGAVGQPMGHTAEGVAVTPTRQGDNPMAIAPAGCIYMSIRDWAKFASMHTLGDRANPHRDAKVLSQQAFDFLHTPRLDGYAGGWSITQRAWADGPDEDMEGRVLTHAGSNTMWFAVVRIAPEKNIAMLACTNIDGDSGPKAADEAIQVLLREFGLMK